jgi:hypothetical protein
MMFAIWAWLAGQLPDSDLTLPADLTQNSEHFSTVSLLASSSHATDGVWGVHVALCEPFGVW